MSIGTNLIRWFSALFAAIILAVSGSWSVAPADAATRKTGAVTGR